MSPKTGCLISPSLATITLATCRCYPSGGRGVVLYSGLVCLSLFLETMLAEGGRGGGNGRASSFPLSKYLTAVEPFVLRRGAGWGGGGGFQRIGPVCHAFVRFTDGAARRFCADAPNCPPACPNFLPHFQFFLPVSRKRSITEQLKLFRLDSEVRCWSWHCRHYSHCRH